MSIAFHTPLIHSVVTFCEHRRADVRPNQIGNPAPRHDIRPSSGWSHRPKSKELEAIILKNL